MKNLLYYPKYVYSNYKILYVYLKYLDFTENLLMQNKNLRLALSYYVNPLMPEF